MAVWGSSRQFRLSADCLPIAAAGRDDTSFLSAMALLPDFEDQVIKEGFLCPICLEDFPGINDLQAHFTSGIHDEKSDGDGDDVGVVS